MTVKELNLLVSEAILRADALADLEAPGAAQAYLEVSLIEERLAEALPASRPQGAIARRGAVRAAGVAGDDHRARELAARYLAEEDAGPDLREEIKALVTAREDGFAAHDPQTARHYGFAEILRVTRALVEESEPFPVAC